MDVGAAPVGDTDDGASLVDAVQLLKMVLTMVLASRESFLRMAVLTMVLVSLMTVRLSLAVLTVVVHLGVRSLVGHGGAGTLEMPLAARREMRFRP